MNQNLKLEGPPLNEMRRRLADALITEQREREAEREAARVEEKNAIDSAQRWAVWEATLPELRAVAKLREKVGLDLGQAATKAELPSTLRTKLSGCTERYQTVFIEAAASAWQQCQAKADCA